MTTSDGSTADYYELPKGATQLQDLISHRDMNAQLGEIFRATYRYGMASHSGKLRDAKKIKFYIDSEIKRLEVLLAKAKVDGCCETIDPADVDIASAIDDDSERMQAIGQNGEMAEEVYAAVDAAPKIYGLPSWSDAPDWAEWLAMDGNGEWYWYERPIRAAKRRDLWEYGPISGAVESAAYSPEEVRPDWRTTLQARPAK